MDTPSENEQDCETDPLELHIYTSRSSSDQLVSAAEMPYAETASELDEAEEDPEQNPASSRWKTKMYRFDFGGFWAWEICSATVAVLGIVLLVGFLVKIDGTPYAKWQYTVVPNTVISIIMTISKAALLVPVSACLGQLKWNLYRRSTPLEYMQTIDEASRGSWGSLQVLWRVISGSRMGILTCSGAFLTLIALAIDPFAQQILSFPSRIIQASNETAFIQYSHNYSSGTTTYGDTYISTDGLTLSLPQAIMAGLSLANTALQPQCSSGSCSYPNFVSLGICSHCEDITEQTVQECEGNALEWQGMAWVPSNAGINCIYTSPYGFNFSLALNDLIYANIGEQNASIFPVRYWSSISRGSDRTFDIDFPIVSFLAISQELSIVYTPDNATVAPPKPSLGECTMYWCEKEYAPSNYSASGYTTPVFQTQQLGWWDAALTPPPGLKSLSNESSGYYITPDILVGLQNQLIGLFNENSSSQSYTMTPTLSISGLLQISNITEVVESISTSLTDTIRAAESSGRIPGTAFRDETFISVRWSWIILPLCVVLGSVMLLSATIIATRKDNAVLWKSSVFPLLMSYLDIAPEYNFSSLRNVDEVQRISKKINVTIERDHGLVLSER